MAAENTNELPPVVTIDDLSCGYAGKVVVGCIQFLMRRGEFCAVAGMNGSGKSTFLATVVGLLPPVKGEIRFGSLERKTFPIGYVPQAEKLDPIFPVSVEDIVLMGASARGKRDGPTRREQRQIALDALTSVGLAELRKHRLSELSGGQKQRVLLARALATQTELLVLDEPTSGVDREAERDLIRLLAEIRERGVSILMATHNLDLIVDVAQMILWFRDGRVEAGSTAELLPKLTAGKGGTPFFRRLRE